MARQLYELCGSDPQRVFSPFCWRSRMALAHKGLEFESIPWRFTETQRLSTTPVRAVFDYGVTYDPIVTRMGDDRSLLVEARYRGAQWGFGARGWQVRTDGGLDGIASTRTPTSDSLSVTGIRMWDHSLVPVTNTLHPSEISPVTYHAENTLETFRVEAFGERRWLAGANLNVATRFGLAYAQVDNTRHEGSTMSAFFEETSGDSMLTFFNDITLESESESTLTLTGPMLALAGDMTFRRLHLDWVAGQSVLLGTTETSGRWTDVDDITEIEVTSGTTTVFNTLLNGSIPMSRDERTIVPVLDLQLKASVRATRAVRLGAGVFSSTWFRLPVAPAFSVPGNWTDVEGTGWHDRKRDVTFNAVSVFAAVDF